MSNQTLKRYTLIIIPLSSFINPFMGSSLNIALPAIENALQVHAVLLSWVQSSFLLASAVCLIPFGRLSDILGRKKIFLQGMFLFTIATALAGLAPNQFLFFSARVLQGIGSSMVVVNAIGILISVFPPEERGKVLGINVAAVYTGLASGPLIGGFLTHYISWRALFFFTIPISLTVISLTLYKLKDEWAQASQESFDLSGAFIYSVTIISFMYGLSILASNWSIALILIGFISLLIFIRRETKCLNPVFEIDLFRRNRLFAFSNVAAFLLYLITYSVPFLLSLYLQHIKGFTPHQAGLVLIIQPVIMALFSPLSGKLSDKFEPFVLSSLGLFLQSCGFIFLTFISAQSSLAYILASLTIIGLGLALFSSPNVNAIMGSVQTRQYGIAAATAGTMRLLGQACCMGVVSLVFSVHLGKVKIGPEKHSELISSLETIFLLCVFLSLTAVVISLLRGKLRP